MPLPPEVRTRVGRVGALARGVRAGERSQQELDAARADLARARIGARLESCIDELVDAAPLLTDHQLTRLAALLEST